ncbi:MAG: NAD-dependent dehydratase [Thaumarchaeota archaeon]|nr:MAG: NAD-dependent dehydratase [Nitrososphaerota archaeon]
MKVLVTGGAGFIGKYLVSFLLKKDYTVTIFDNFSNSTKESISHFIQMGVNVIEGDIINSLDIQDASKNHDIVIHLAAKISVSESIDNPSETFQVNVDGTKNVLASCEKNHVKKLIAASSAAVYGEGNQDVNLTEETKMNPISPYGESKVMMEEIIRQWKSSYNFNYVILRFFNIYGIGQSSEYAGVITKCLEKIKQKKPIEIFGDGLQTRDFVAIEDVINAIYNAMQSSNSGTYNIASGKTITINELVNKMILLSRKKLEIKHIRAKKGEIRFSHADISKAKKEIGFSPKINLDRIKELLEEIR